MQTNEPNRSKRKCIFCGQQGKLSREHVWPDWLSSYLQRPGKRNYHWVNSSGEPKKGKLSRPGDAHSQTLKVVCASCNSGWMSQLQTDARPYLSRLLQDEWPILDLGAQAVLARWAAMFTMVIEFADPNTAVIPQAHRSTLMTSGQLSTEWVIWIGRHNPERYHPALFNHFGIKGVTLKALTRQAVEQFIQTTAFTVGKLYMQTCMVAPLSSNINITADSFAQAHDMRIIHPPHEEVSRRPTTAHKHIEIQRISNATVSGFGSPTMEIAPREDA